MILFVLIFDFVLNDDLYFGSNKFLVKETL